MEINWLEKRRNGYTSGSFKDVGIFLIPKEKAVRLAFRNGCERKITTEDFAQVGYSEKRIYFRKSSENSGLKITRISSGKSKYMRIKDADLFNILNGKEGERELFFDSKEKMYFVFINERDERLWQIH